MAANLTQPKIKASIEFNFAKASPLYTLATGLIPASFSLTPLAAIANSGYAGTITLAAAGTQTIDLIAGLDPLGDAIVATKAMGIIIIPANVAGGVVQMAPGAANPLTWFIQGTTPTLTVLPGGVLCYADPVGVTVDSTHKTLLFTNTGSVPVTFSLVIFCKQ